MLEPVIKNRHPFFLKKKLFIGKLYQFLRFYNLNQHQLSELIHLLMILNNPPIKLINNQINQ